jgi:NitT/TauT family transport system substrate-binding protein
MSTTPSRRVRPALRLLAGTLLLATVATACGTDDEPAGGTAEATMEIDVGYIPDMNGGAVVAIAEDQDLWAESGLEPNAQAFTNGPTQIQAMAAGDLDIGYIGPGASWLPASGQATIITLDNIGFGDFVIARPDSGIRTPADLKGKKVGVPEGTSGDMIMRLALESAGLTYDDVELTQLDPTTIVTAYTSGQVDAAGIFAPQSEQMRSAVPGTVTVADNRDFYPEDVFFGSWVVRNEVLENEPELVKRFLEVFQQATDYRKANVDETVELTAAYTKGNAEQLAAQAKVTQYLSTDDIAKANESGDAYRWMNGLQEIFVASGRLEQAADPEEFFDQASFATARGQR